MPIERCIKSKTCVYFLLTSATLSDFWTCAYLSTAPCPSRNYQICAPVKIKHKKLFTASFFSIIEIKKGHLHARSSILSTLYVPDVPCSFHIAIVSADIFPHRQGPENCRYRSFFASADTKPAFLTLLPPLIQN